MARFQWSRDDTQLALDAMVRMRGRGQLRPRYFFRLAFQASYSRLVSSLKG